MSIPKNLEIPSGMEVIKKDGEVTGFKIRYCVARDPLTYKQIWKTHTIKANDPRLNGLTKKKYEDELDLIKKQWCKDQKKQYKESHGESNKIHDDAITLKSFINNKWIPNHVNGGKLTPTTQAFYGYMANDIVEFFGNHLKIADIDREAIEHYETFLRTKAKTKQGKPLSETSVRRHLETLRNILRYALKNKYVKEDIFQTYSIETKSDAAETVDFLTPDEAQRFVELLKVESDKNKSVFWETLMRIALTCGLRRGELVGLQWQDVDFDLDRIRVRRNVTINTKNETGIHIGQTKAKKQRIAHITPTIRNLLIKLKSEYEEKYKKEMPESAFIFCTSRDYLTPIYPTTPETWIKRFEKRNGLRPLSMHDLRHTAGTLAKIAGFDLKDIQIMLGHSDLKTTTKFYIGIDEEAQRRTVEGIESLIG